MLAVQGGLGIRDANLPGEVMRNAQLAAPVRSVTRAGLGRGIVRVTRVIRVRDSGSGRAWSVGFTLMEIIVSLAVLAVATTIGVSMFTRSYSLGKELRERRAAQSIAREILSDMQRDPAAYTWPAANETLQAVVKKEGDAEALPPSVTATLPSVDQHIRELYRKLKWRAYARLPKPESKTCELTVVVHWIHSGQTKSFTLTTLAPRRVLEGKS